MAPRRGAAAVGGLLCGGARGQRPPDGELPGRDLGVPRRRALQPANRAGGPERDACFNRATPTAAAGQTATPTSIAARPTASRRANRDSQAGRAMATPGPAGPTPPAVHR